MHTIQGMVKKIIDDHNKYRDKIEQKVIDWQISIDLAQKEHHFSKMQELKDEIVAIQNRQKEFSEFVTNRNGSEAIKLNVSGQEVDVARSTLMTVKDSLLAAKFSGNAPMGKDSRIFLDRNPLIFNYMIDYLRSDRKVLPMDISSDKKKGLENEIKYWQVDRGISKIYDYTHPDAQMLDEML